MQLSVYVVGNGSLFASYFNMVAMLVGEGAFDSAIRLFIMLGGCMTLIKYIRRRDLMDFVRWFGVYYLVIFILLVPKVTVVVEDQIIMNQSDVVDNVPLGLALIAHVSSSFGMGMTHMIEKVFHESDELSYSKTGMIMASRMLSTANQFQITDPDFNKDLQSFVQQCIFYDLLLKRYTFKDLLNTNNIWGLVQENASKARAFTQSGKVTTCAEGIGSLQGGWQSAIEQAQTRYGARLFPGEKDAKAQLIKFLPASYKMLTDISSSASELMKQHLLANAIQEGVPTMAAKTNASAAIGNYINTKSQVQQRSTFQSVGEQAAVFLPLLKNALEMIMYGAFIFVVLFALLPTGMTILTNYVLVFFWLELWAPIFALINFSVSYFAQAKSLALASGVGPSLHNLDGLATINMDMASLAGYLTMISALLSAALIKGLQVRLEQIAQYVGGTLQSTASQVAGEATAGSINLGNSSIDNHQAFNNSAHHWDTTGRLASGGVSTTMAGGGTMALTADGTQIMNMSGGMSQLGTTIRIADSIRVASSEQADSAYTAGYNNMRSYGETLTAGMRDFQDLSMMSGKMESSGTSSMLSENSSLNRSLTEMHRLTEKFARDHNISDQFASEVLTAAYVNSSVGISGTWGPVKGKVDVGLKHDSTDRKSSVSNELASAAEDYIKESGYSAVANTGLSAIHDHQYRFNTEEGNRLATHLNASLDQADHYRTEASSNFQKAESYRKTASYAAENAQTIDTNASQSFYEWWRTQPGTNGSGHLSDEDIQAIQQHDPQLAAMYAQRYAGDYAEKMTQNWQGDLAGSPVAISRAFGNNNEFVSGGTQVAHSQYQAHQQQIMAQAGHDGVSPGHVIDRRAPIADEAVTQVVKQKIEGGDQKVSQGGSDLTAESKEKIDHQKMYHIWNSASKE